MLNVNQLACCFKASSSASSGFCDNLEKENLENVPKGKCHSSSMFLILRATLLNSESLNSSNVCRFVSFINKKNSQNQFRVNLDLSSIIQLSVTLYRHIPVIDLAPELMPGFICRCRARKVKHWNTNQNPLDETLSKEDSKYLYIILFEICRQPSIIAIVAILIIITNRKQLVCRN